VRSLLRKPLALTNWKMAMTASEGVSFIEEFTVLTGALLDHVDVVICPPYTTLWPMKEHLRDRRIGLGGQNVAPSIELARTGEVSAALLIDAGCRWVLLGHWEVRRHLGDDEYVVNRKLHVALESGLAPILLVGEALDTELPLEETLGRQLAAVLAGCDAEHLAAMAFVYEPQGAIGVSAPASPERVAKGCTCIRRWIRERWGDAIADRVRIIYGGSVTPVQAAELLASPEVDGLGATRRGRDPASFAEIVRQIVLAKT